MASTQTIERKPPAALEVLYDRLTARRHEIAKALAGSGISPDRFIRTAITAATSQASLVADVSFQSLWDALLKACRDRLLPDGKQGAIVPYKGKATWIPMYRGLLDRFEQSGEYKWITANLHREDDLAWDIWIDEHGQHFMHRPGPGMGDVIETYAAALTKSGGFFLTVITEPDMNRIRAASRARAEESPWQQWTDQMRLKSAIRRLCKTLPMPHELDELMDEDEEAAFGKSSPVALAPPVKPARPRGAQNALEQFAGEAGEPEASDVRKQPQSEPEPEPTGTIPQINIDTAHERGKQAKIDGFKRTAIPPEYREPNRGREAIAWRQGWDGEPLPQSTGADHEPR